MAIRSTAAHQHEHDAWAQTRSRSQSWAFRPSPSRFFTEASPVSAYPVDPGAIAALPPPDAIPTTSPSLDIGHASPLAPLRQRDTEALEELFIHDRIQEITLDVYQYLARTYPEPCWEDEPYEFLHGYV